MAMPEALQGQVSKALLSDQVYEILRAQLIAHELAPGSRLVESSIARGLSISQAPVREALRRLAHDGMVLQVPRLGSFVAELSLEDTRDAYALRAALEPLAVEGALRHSDVALIASLENILDEMLQAADADDLSALIDADVRFHQTVWSASGNALLPRVWQMITPTMRNLTSISNRVFFQDLHQIARTHVPLIDALRAGKPEAPELFREHAVAVWQRLLQTPASGNSSLDAE